ncbi:hypothetical protein NU195Hw_Modified_433t1 [Hortaea werneckii]
MFAMKPTEAVPARRIVKVGIVGRGMITQITCLYDVSEDATKHSQFKVAGASKPWVAQSVGPIRYARVRDIIGPNSTFISQSAAFPRTFNDYREADTADLHRKTRADTEQALQTELGIGMTKERKVMWDYLSMLGSHNLSAMREIIGMPTGVIGFSPCSMTGSPFWNAISGILASQSLMSLVLTKFRASTPR